MKAGDKRAFMLSHSAQLSTVAAGGTSLSYDATTETYNYKWKTESGWTGACRQLIIRLNDGTEHKAYFNFR